MATKSYDIKKLPLPIRPGDTVYFVLEDGSIEVDTAEAVGINEDGVLLVNCEDDLGGHTAVTCRCNFLYHSIGARQEVQCVGLISGGPIVDNFTVLSSIRSGVDLDR